MFFQHYGCDQMDRLLWDTILCKLNFKDNKHYMCNTKGLNTSVDL